MDHETTLEEGEISNDSDTNYTPLERPSQYSANAQPHARFANVLPSESDEELGSSDSDSDSDSAVKKIKKPKIKLKPKTSFRKNTQKKYDIWSTRVQDEVLAATLNSCDVTIKDRSRDVEAYDFSLGNKYADKKNTKDILFKEEFRKNNKRTRADRSNTHFRQRKRSVSRENDNISSKPRLLLDLTVNLDSTEDEIAEDIANKLYEEKQDLILKVVNTLGKKKSLELFEKTKKIEGEGGVLIMNKTRRRTPGGVYFYLVRQDKDITYQQQHTIFDEERSRNKQKNKMKLKEKYKRMKQKNATLKSEFLPDLLSRAELLASQNPGRKIKEQTDENEVINPPPTPETDGGQENSGEDNIEYLQPIVNTPSSNRGKLNSYDEDFLDLGCAIEMDLF